MHHIDYVCHQNRSGYAQSAQDYLYALKSQKNYNLHVTLLHSSPDQLAITAERYRDMMVMLNHPLDDDHFVQVFHCIPGMQRRAWRGGKTVGFGTFETLDPPKDWVEQLNRNDAVICPSRFCVEIFQNAGVTKPIHYIPHVFDTVSYHTEVNPSKQFDKFTFLFFGSWKFRKGWRELFEAWFREFKADDNVQILIKTDRLSESNKAINEIRKKLGLSEKETAPILYETKILNENELPRFLKSADCLISPTYGEGFGLPGLQCMALGVPVIITDYSGCRDYATEDTATLLKPGGFILYNQMDNIPQFGQKKWSQVSVQEVMEKMRYVIENSDITREKALRAASVVARKFNYSDAVDGFTKMMGSL